MRRYLFGLAILGCAAFAPLMARGDDQQIAQTVMQKLAQEKQAGNLRGFGIEVKVENGTVFMNGRVSSAEQQRLALECAQRTEGVAQVVDELSISQQASETAGLGQSSRRTHTPTAGSSALLQPVAAAPHQGIPARQAVYQMPRAFAPAHSVAMRTNQVGGMPAGPVPQYLPGSSGGVTPAQYDHPQMPGYAWPSYASHPNYAAVTYPKQYSPTA